jgi:hypothetical protein
MVSNSLAAYLHEGYKEEIAVVNVITGRRGVLKILG